MGVPPPQVNSSSSTCIQGVLKPIMIRMAYCTVYIPLTSTELIQPFIHRRLSKRGQLQTHHVVSLQNGRGTMKPRVNCIAITKLISKTFKKYNYSVSLILISVFMD